ncbi:MAG TPA: N-acetylmuramoyl-L-alanine amidase [Gemmatimonadaceae bacterium]|nr:N-acetylmuramoyl-L-alanine amidase [Gemmatimonadaceae bacterium]
MIIAILLGLQIGTVPPSVVSARAGAVESVVPLVETSAGRVLRLDRLAPALPVTVRADGPGRFVVSVFDVAMTLADQVPYARVGASVIPLGGAPLMDRGALLVPLQLISEVLPRLAPARLSYDPVRSELRVAGPTTTANASVPRPRTRRRVVVDAGHGGPDNGMTGPIGGRQKIREKDITLAVSHELAKSLRRHGVEVIMTRTTDTLIGLYDRGPIANERGGDLFLSIHVNAANLRWRRPGDARGYETYFLAEAKTEDERRVERMENEAIRFETTVQAPKNDPLSFIIHDMAQNEHLRESQELAAAIQAGLGRVHPGPSRGVKQAGFVVLTTAFMPAVLVEIGFGTNAAEAQYLASPTRQRELADAIASATMAYLEGYERRLGSAGR